MYGFGGLGEVEVEIWSDVTIAGRTTTKRKDRATQPMDHGRLRSAIILIIKDLINAGTRFRYVG